MSSYVYFAGATLRFTTGDYPFTSISGTPTTTNAQIWLAGLA